MTEHDPIDTNAVVEANRDRLETAGAVGQSAITEGEPMVLFDEANPAEQTEASAEAAAQRRQTRLLISINEDLTNFLIDQRERGVSVTESTRRAFACYKLLLNETGAGNTIWIESADGSQRKIKLADAGKKSKP